MTKKQAALVAPLLPVSVRIYADIQGVVDSGLERIAKANGRTKKGQIEFLINSAVAEFDALEVETNKRAKGKK